MSLSNLKKVQAQRVLGIDCSTKSLGFAVFDGRTPMHAGEVFFNGANLYERLNDAHRKIPALVQTGLLKADYIGFEGAWLGPSPQTGLNLAYVYGAVIGALMQEDMKVVTVQPLAWQSYIGNPQLKKADKERLKAETPGKSDSWYKTHFREYRKQRTFDWAKQHFDIASGSDNISDAVGVAWYTANHLTR